MRKKMTSLTLTLSLKAMMSDGSDNTLHLQCLKMADLCSVLCRHRICAVMCNIGGYMGKNEIFR